MNRCHFQKDLSAYIDNQLREKEKERFDEHLKTCVVCNEELLRLKALSEGLKQWQAPELSPGFERALQNKILAQELEGGEVKMKRKPLTVLIPSGVLAGILVFAVIGIALRYTTRGMQGRITAPQAEKAEVVQRVDVPKAVRQAIPPKVVSKFGLEGIKYEAYYLSSQMSLKEDIGLRFSTAVPVQNADVRGGPMFGSAPGVDSISGYYQAEEFNTEGYDRIYDNDFLQAIDNPLSTFSIDVDTASYSNVRRFLNYNQLPPKDAVRIEEMVNYFSYNYPQPAAGEPFSVTTKVGACVWNNGHKIVLIGLQGKAVDLQQLPPSNLVFLLDVSGSMNQPNKLPLLQSAFRLLAGQLRPQDKVSIVTYAGAAGLVLDSASGDQKNKVLDAIDNLRAGGSTAGSAGIQLAYEIAKKNFIKDGNNRVILATDGDFNVGVSSDGELTRMIEEKRDDGIFLTVLGFGMGNYKDAKMEKLADKGNGNLAYIDNLLEAKKVFVTQLTGTLFTIAKDVKIQVEFNPAQVKAYRLIGYENRMLKKEDFNDDKKDAGEIGAGHTVTALYEIVPADSKEAFSNVDPLQYQKVSVAQSDDLLTVKLRYKEPDADESKLITKTISCKEKPVSADADFEFATAVVEFGLVLRDSQYKGTASYQDVLQRAKAAKGKDADGYRAEFIKLVEIAQMLDAKHN